MEADAAAGPTAELEGARVSNPLPRWGEPDARLRRSGRLASIFLPTDIRSRCFEPSNPVTVLAQLDIMAIDQLLGPLDCCIVVSAV